MSRLVKNFSLERIRQSRGFEREEALQNAINQFNIDPEKGIRNLCVCQQLPLTNISFATVLLKVDGLLPSQVGKYLSKHTNEDILFHYFLYLDLSASLTEAMHQAFSSNFKLPSEAEEIDYILQIFSKAFKQLHPKVFPKPNTTFILAFALLMLNTDLHGRQRRRMSCHQFLANTRLAIPSEDLPDLELKRYYREIQLNPIRFENQFDESFAKSAPCCTGPLKRRRNLWCSISHERYFVLLRTCLYYYKDQSFLAKRQPKGMIQLDETEILPQLGTNMFVINSKDRKDLKYVKFGKKGPQAVSGIKKIFLEAENDRYLAKWMFRIRQEQTRSTHGSLSSSGLPRLGEVPLERSMSQEVLVTRSRRNTLHNFY